MAQGVVKTVTDKGYGFISTEESTSDVFYHESILEGELADRKLMQGDHVIFDIVPSDRDPSKMNASNIQLVDGEAEDDSEEEAEDDSDSDTEEAE